MDNLEEVQQRFTARVNEYLAEVKAAAEEAKKFAEANEEAKLATDGLRDKALEAADAFAWMRREENKAADDALRLEVAAAELGHVRDKAAEAAVAVKKLKDEERGAAESGLLAKFSGGGGGGLGPWLIGGGIAAALAALPALMAAGGAAAGIALGAGLLVGTQRAKGPLYKSFHDLTDGLTQVLRISALPLVQPLAQAFAQIGQWARSLYPVLHQVFGSLGPLVMPFAKGLEGLVSGILPGFLHLMQAAKPAVQAVGQILSQLGTSIGGTLGTLAAGVKGSSQFLSGLSGIVSSLLPLIANLADILATSLGPVLQAVGQKLMPVLADALDKILQAAIPLIPPFAGITAQLIELGAKVIALLTGPLAGLASNLLGLATKVLPTLIGPIETVIGWLDNMATAAENVLGFLSKIPGLGWLAPASASAGLSGWAGTAAGAVGGPSLGSAVADATAAGFGTWASGAWPSGSGSGASTGATVAQVTAANTLGRQITAALGSGVRETIPQARAAARTLMADIRRELASGAITAQQAASLVNTVDKALAAHIAATQKAARKLGESLTTALAEQIASSASASTMKTAIGKLFADIKTAYDAGVISLSQDRHLSAWLAGQAQQLETLAAQRAKITAEITQARQFAAQTASNVAGNFSLTGFATSGLNGGAATVGQVITGLRVGLHQIRKWAHNIHKLAKEGLNRSFLGQLIALGPVQGAALAEELANANLGDIKAINSAEYQISEVSGQVGKLAANAMYDSGKNAGRGFLSGLLEQKKAITQLMEEIARSMIAALKKELKVSVPGGAGGYAIGGAGGNGGSPSVHVSVPVNVQGGGGAAYQSPEFMQYMQRIVQEAVLRYGQLNPSNGLSPGWGRG